MWDLIVIGGGPAGSSAALAALQQRPTARVLLLDRADFPRDKACGDGIAPHALDILLTLGFDPAAVVEGYRPVDRLELGFACGPQVRGLMQRPAHVVPRAVFDARLVEAAVARGAVLRRQRVRTVTHASDCVLVDGEAARVVVGADGANGVVRRQVGVSSPPDGTVAVAIRGYAPVRREHAEVQVITFARSGWPAYAWTFPLGDGRANIGYGEVVRPGAPLRRTQLLDRLDELLPSVSTGATDLRAHHLPLSTGRPRQPDGRVLLAGDALSLVNPLTGEGIYYAVHSGALAGRAAVRRGVVAEPGAAYRRDLAAALGRHLRHTSAVASLASRSWVFAAGVKAAARHPAVFDDLVELGLGRGLLTPRVVSGLAASLLLRRR